MNMRYHFTRERGGTMNVTGKITAVKVIIKEASILFKCEEDVRSLSVDLSKYVGQNLLLRINENFDLSAEMHEYRCRKRKATLFLQLDMDEENAKKFISLEGKGYQHIEMKIDQDKDIPEEIIDLSYVSLLKRMIRQIARNIGKTPDELEKLLKYKWGNSNIRLENMRMSQANSFREILIDWGERTETDFDLQSDNYSIKKFIEMRRKEGLCIVCNENSILNKYSLFPVCEKHRKEYILDSEAFKRRYHLNL